MFDHIGIRIKDYPRSKAFYEKALAPLGIAVLKEIGPELAAGEWHCGFGTPGMPDFWIGTAVSLSGPVHIAFAAKDRAAVDAFYRAAIAAGATDHGAPGLRPIYHPTYYGAFVLDPDGNNIEAVCHDPQ